MKYCIIVFCMTKEFHPCLSGMQVQYFVLFTIFCPVNKITYRNVIIAYHLFSTDGHYTRSF